MEIDLPTPQNMDGGGSQNLKVFKKSEK